MSSLEGNISGKQSLTGEASMLLGLTPNIQVGTTEMLDPNASAIVELDANSTKLNPILNFGIPKGEKGEKGDAGSIEFIIVNELPTENINENALYLKPSNNPLEENSYEEYVYINGAWESLGSAKVEVNLTDYVKNTDYATATTAGVVKRSEGQVGGINISTTNPGVLIIARATNSIIDARTPNDYIDSGTMDNNRCRPICPANVDYAVKKALADNKLTDTDNAWTEEEKASARDLINTIKKAEYNSTDGSLRGRVYVVDSFNTQTTKELRIVANADSIPLRNPNGNFYVNTPTLEFECTNKKYVDSRHVTLTQAEYDDLVIAGTVDETVFYYIKEE
jgi:hypothetical protein